MPSSIPAFYRVCFTMIDPVLMLWGVYTNLFDPVEALRLYTPTPADPPALETLVMMDGMAGFFVAFAFLQAVLLRVRADDVAVWKLLQGSGIIIDAFLMVGTARALGHEARVHVGHWRAEEWSNFGVTLVATAVRVLFIAGLGLGGKRKWNAAGSLYD